MLNSLKNTNSTKSVLVVVAHTDDEAIGAAGTLAKLSRQGYKVFAMSMTDGVSARAHDKRDVEIRKQSALLAAKEIGYEWIFQGDLPDNGLDSVPLLQVIKAVEQVKF
jgi:LmbE family N-acetylglucosaminyl deacetylase